MQCVDVSAPAACPHGSLRQASEDRDHAPTSAGSIAGLWDPAVVRLRADLAAYVQGTLLDSYAAAQVLRDGAPREHAYDAQPRPVWATTVRFEVGITTPLAGICLHGQHVTPEPADLHT